MLGARKCIDDKLRSCRLVIVTSSFSDRLAEFREWLDRDSINYRQATHSIRPREIHREFAAQNESPLLLAPASLLTVDDSPAGSVDTSYRVMVLGLERHPMRLFDERIDQFAAAVPYETELQFYVSLEDAVMKIFAGDWVREVLQRLGMKEDEAISSSMVARRLKGAQRKVEQRYEALHGMQAGTARLHIQADVDKDWKSALQWLQKQNIETPT